MSRRTIRPFGHGNSFYARFPKQRGAGHQRSLGTDNKATADLICAMLIFLRGQGEWYLLDRLADGTASITEAYAAYSKKEIDDHIKRLRHGPVAIDLEPFVAKWESLMIKSKVPAESTRREYMRHVRRLIPADGPDPDDKGSDAIVHFPFMSADFTADRIREFFETLTKVGVTNRYRASLSAFCQYLNEHAVANKFISENVALEVAAQPLRPARVRWLDHADAKALIDAIEGDEAKAWSALAVATGMERIAIIQLCHKDVKPATFFAHAHGTKKKHRDRGATTPRFFEWAWDIFAAWYKPGPASERVFAITPALAYWRMKAACDELGVEDFTMHDWRHCFAVCALQAGLEPVAIARQLGHKNTQQLWTTYGQYIPNASAMRPPLPAAPAPQPQAPTRKPKKKR